MLQKSILRVWLHEAWFQCDRSDHLNLRDFKGQLGDVDISLYRELNYIQAIAIAR